MVNRELGAGFQAEPHLNFRSIRFDVQANLKSRPPVQPLGSIEYVRIQLRRLIVSTPK